MKLLYLFLLFGCSCVGAKKTIKSNSNESSLYVINRIKKLEGWNVIYASKGDSIFKVITKQYKNQSSECRIKKGKIYKLQLRWILENDQPQVSNYADVGCFDYGPKLRICIEPKKGIYKLYYTHSLKGLCFIGE